MLLMYPFIQYNVGKNVKIHWIQSSHRVQVLLYLHSQYTMDTQSIYKCQLNSPGTCKVGLNLHLAFLVVLHTNFVKEKKSEVKLLFGSVGPACQSELWDDCSLRLGWIKSFDAVLLRDDMVVQQPLGSTHGGCDLPGHWLPVGLSALLGGVGVVTTVVKNQAHYWSKTLDQTNIVL